MATAHRQSIADSKVRLAPPLTRSAAAQLRGRLRRRLEVPATSVRQSDTTAWVVRRDQMPPGSLEAPLSAPSPHRDDRRRHGRHARSVSEAPAVAGAFGVSSLTERPSVPVPRSYAALRIHFVAPACHLVRPVEEPTRPPLGCPARSRGRCAPRCDGWLRPSRGTRPNLRSGMPVEEPVEGLVRRRRRPAVLELCACRGRARSMAIESASSRTSPRSRRATISRASSLTVLGIRALPSACDARPSCAS
jgi:hypothetical protein